MSCLISGIAATPGRSLKSTTSYNGFGVFDMTTESSVIDPQKQSRHTRASLPQTTLCSCFYWFKEFYPHEVGKWTNGGENESPLVLKDCATMTEHIRFFIDGVEVEAAPGETIWQVADRQGIEIPHLCWLPKPGYRADGNCRACMVEIEGERVLAASCVRKPTPGMKVHSASERARASRKLVFELLVSDQPARTVAHDPNSRFWQWADRLGVGDSRFPLHAALAPDRSHPAMAVQLDACIQCNLCVRACREVQVNDVIGMAARGYHEKIIFDFDDPMGNSTCVACGECVQACPTGALMPSTLVDANGIYANAPDR